MSLISVRPITTSGSRGKRKRPQAFPAAKDHSPDIMWSRAARAGAWIAIGAVLLGQQLPFEPTHESGQSVTGAFEGWFPNADGSISLLAGYFNRNAKQEFDISPGPNNRIEPGGPDQGQPTHFLPGRQWGVFTIT